MRPFFVALTSAMSVVAFTQIASAADLYQPAYKAAPPPPALGWTGWYVGVNAGASFGDVKTDFNVSPVGCPQSGCDFTVAHAFSDREYPGGFIGGAQIGYNWWYSPLFVVGFEADFQGALERDSANLSNSFSDMVGEVSVQAATNYTTQIDWFGTVRGRIGYVWGNGEVMSYVTGGLAYGEVKINGTNTVSFFCGICSNALGNPGIAGSVSQSFGHSQVNTGWVVGYGTEGHLRLMPGNWTWKIEGLYVDLGHLDATGVTTGISTNGPTGTLFGGQVTSHSHFTDGILRGGLNYHF